MSAEDYFEQYDDSYEGLTAPRAGQPWYPQEDAMLRTCVKNLLTVQQIAEHHRRSTGAILARTERLGIGPYETGEYDPYWPGSKRVGAKVAAHVFRATNPPAPTGNWIRRAWLEGCWNIDTKATDMNVRTMHIVTLLQTGYTTCEVYFGAAKTGQRYTYKVAKDLADKLNPDMDQVVVPVRDHGELQVAKVAVVHAEPEIDVQAPYALKWVVCRVDRAAFDDQVAREVEAVKMLQKAERTRAQQEALKALLGDASLDQLRQLLNPKKLEG